MPKQCYACQWAPHHGACWAQSQCIETLHLFFQVTQTAHLITAAQCTSLQCMSVEPFCTAVQATSRRSLLDGYAGQLVSLESCHRVCASHMRITQSRFQYNLVLTLSTSVLEQVCSQHHLPAHAHSQGSSLAVSADLQAGTWEAHCRRNGSSSPHTGSAKQLHTA